MAADEQHIPRAAGVIHPSLAGFHLPVQTWFARSFVEPTRVQQLGWPAIQSGGSSLILAPTGSGKTLAAFLTALDRVMFDPVPDSKVRCRVLYISPLKALAVDVERNLRAPLVGIARQAEQLEIPYHTPEVAIRTGDTPSKERQQFQRHPADILITTPESLYLMLTGQAREALRSVRWVIVDEIHALVPTKRGAHLSLSLERLEELTAHHGGFQRIGLSATQRPLEEVARYLGGFESIVNDPDAGHEVADFLELDENEGSIEHAPKFRGVERPVQIVDAGSEKRFDLRVVVPVEDMARLGEVQEIPTGNAASETRTSIWPAIHPMILELIRSHRSTLIFVNSRRLAERLAASLNELAGEEIVHAHHGSIAREKRLQIEEELKSGKLPAMVATSSLELGIDMGAIDLVIQVEAPPSVASAIQRIGRAGHQVGAPSEGVIVPKFRGDLLACAALTERVLAGAVEPMRYPRNPLDVLAQQIVAMVSMDDWTVDGIEAAIRRSAPFAELPRTLFLEVLDMLSGRYPADDFAELRPRLTWDRIAGTLASRLGAKRIAIANGGTIPDRGLYGVFLASADSDASERGKGKGRVGELDEEMVHETRAGEVFLLGASSWRVEEITHDRVLVSPAPGEPGKMPFWHGDRPGRPLEFGQAIGALTRTLLAQSHEDAIKRLKEPHALDDLAARNLMQYLHDQVEAAGCAPDDRTVVIESYQDDMGDWRVCLLSPFGARVLAPWALAIAARLRDATDTDVDILWTDDGIVVRLPESDEPPSVDIMLPDPDEAEDLVIRQLGSGGSARQDGTGTSVALFASRFREAAARALLLPRKNPAKRAPLWQQRKRAAELLQVASRFGSFPIVLETYRECLRDVFDMPAFIQVLRELRSRQIRVVPVTSRIPSPFAASLLFNYVANFIYEGDSPIAERRAQALTVDPAQLRELLGDIALRDLLDPGAIEEVECAVQYKTEERRVRHPDRLHDLLLRLGALSLPELRERGAEDPKDWIDQLVRERRAIPLLIGGETRYAAAEDAGRYRDALGIPPPQGLPDAFLELVDDPLGDLISQYARTHGPFHTTDAALRFGIGIGPVNVILRRMAATGKVMEGEFRPGAVGSEWCEINVLRAIRQKSLARLRREVEPVEPAALGRLGLVWQHVLEHRRGRSALLDTIEQLQGLSLPASVFESEILAARIPNFDGRELDMLLSSGAVLWTGRESLGQHDGRISLYLADSAPYLIDGTPAERPSGPIHGAIRAHLASRGAVFFPQLLQATGGFPPEVLEALWDLVWCGEVTNDTLQPLRAYIAPSRRSPEARARTSARSRYGRAGTLAGRQRASILAAPRSVEPSASGRWSLVSDLVYGSATPTQRLAAKAQILLGRYGVVTREAVQAENIDGGFSAVYGVYKAMEEAGAVRRGYFVAGLGATQFAENSALDRLRALREAPDVSETVVISAVDPANPYGASLPWPERDASRRPMRQAGSMVILMDGAAAAWLTRAERQIVTFLDAVPEREPDEVATAIARALAGLITSGRRRSVFLEEVDGVRTQESSLAGALLEAGFNPMSKGYIKRL